MRKNPDDVAILYNGKRLNEDKVLILLQPGLIFHPPNPITFIHAL